MDFEFSSRRRSSQPPGVVGKLFLSVFFLIFLTAGVLFTSVMAKQIISSLRTRSWQTAECTIISGKIPEKSPYTAEVVYKYLYCGQAYTSHIIFTGYTGSDDYYDAQKLLDKYSVGAHVICRVNPLNPTDAVLSIPGIWTVFELLFPLIFVVIGAGGVFLIWRPLGFSPGNLNRHPQVIAVIVCGVFFIGGLVLMGFAVPTALRFKSAQQWSKVPCRIVRSSVSSHQSNSSHGSNTMYKVEVLFRYSFDNKKHESSRYELFSESSSNYADKKNTVDKLNNNRKQFCYVNPLDPAEAVLNRDSGFLLILLGVVSIVMLLFGGVGLKLVANAVRREHRMKIEEHLSPSQRGPTELQPAVSPAAQFLTLCVPAVIWNGLVSVFVIILTREWLRGAGQLFPSIFISVFVLFGIGFLVMAIRGVRLLFLPKPQLMLSRHPLGIGEQAELRWQFPDYTNRIRRLQIRVALFEVTSDPTGGRLPLSKLIPKWSQDVIDTDRRADIQMGRKPIVIAEMPVKPTPIFKLIWAIVVVEEFENKPPLRLEFPVHVLADQTPTVVNSA